MNNIAICYKGRLGNQMFQYALQRSFELQNYDVKACIDVYDELYNQGLFRLPVVFKNIQMSFATNKQLKSFIKVHEPFTNPATFIPSIYEMDDDHEYVFDGYFQTEKYFSNIREDLLAQFDFTINDKKLFEVSESIRNSNKPVISMHIRRGDYMYSCEHRGICTKQYYDNAITTIKTLLNTDDVRIIVFSDDVEWCKKHYKLYDHLDHTLFDDYQDWYDMYLMSCCDHNIIANSTFSWWGAWLNKNPNKIVIAPDKWLNKLDTPDIWCDDWIKISTD